MSYDFTKAFSSGGNRAPISEEEWAGGWVAIVGGINGIPTAQQFNTMGYIIESKANEAHAVASRALDGLEKKVDKVAGYGLMSDAQATKLAGLSTGATKTAKSNTNGNVLVDEVEVQVYRHPTGEGNAHLPAGGTKGQAVIRTADGYAWGDFTPTDVEAPIKDAPALTTIDDTDTVPFTDTSDSSKTKKITWANIKALLDTWASALFAPKSHTHDDRYYTETEMDSKLSGKLGTSGDGKSTTVTFTEAASRAAPVSGETQATLWGKVKKLFTDLKSVAFSGSYSDLINVPGSFTPSAHNHGAGDINSGTLPVARGGTGATSLTSGYLLMGNGTGAVSAVAPSTVAAKVGVAYGTCSTAAATAAKTVAVSNFTLVAGARVAVTFTNAVPTNATLNVNSTGAKNIRWQGSNVFGGIINAKDTVEFVYTGSYWYILAIDRVAAGAINFADANWETINAIAQAGLAQSFWNKGDQKQVVLTTGETIFVRIEDFNHDTLTAGGTAKMTLGMVNCLAATRQMNSSNTNSGGWGSSAMRTWMTTLLGQMPSDLQAVIKQVNKKTSAGNQSSTISTTADKLWLFSYTEVGFPNDGSYSPGNSTEGTVYPLFVSDASRVKTVNGSAAHWWLRSPYLGGTAYFCFVFSDGTRNYSGASNSYGVAVGFCI
jgi:hypothetical protein